MIYAERQTSWGWMVAAYVFLAGVGGGLFLFSFILSVLGMYETVARIGALIGSVLVLVSTFFLLADLGSITRAYRLFSTPSTFMTSWMTKGAWILAAFIIFGLLYSLPAFKAFEWLPWSQASGVGQGIGIVAALLSVLVVAYPGFLFGVLKSIPFWNTPALPPLFFLSGLDTGIAVIVLTALFFTASFGTGGFHLMGAGDITLIFLLLIVLGAYLEIVRQSSVTAAASVRLLKNPLFVGGVVIVGLLLPLALLIYSIFVTDALVLRILAGITSVFLLAGGLLLRYSVIRGGVPITLH